MPTRIVNLMIIGLIFISQMVLGQNLRSIEASILITNSPSLDIERDYTIVTRNGSDISSSSSFGGDINIKYIEPINHNFAWFGGGNLGVYSLDLDLYVSEEFKNLGWNGYTTNFTEYQISYLSLEGGVRYFPLIMDKGSIAVDLALQANYHIRSHGNLTANAILDNGEVEELFSAEIINNDDNNIVIAPKVGLYYMFYKSEKSINVSIGGNIVVSSSTPFEGRYAIYGDNNILKGGIKKRYFLLGLSIGFTKKLD